VNEDERQQRKLQTYHSYLALCKTNNFFSCSVSSNLLYTAQSDRQSTVKIHFTSNTATTTASTASIRYTLYHQSLMHLAQFSTKRWKSRNNYLSCDAHVVTFQKMSFANTV